MFNRIRITRYWQQWSCHANTAEGCWLKITKFFHILRVFQAQSVCRVMLSEYYNHLKWLNHVKARTVVLLWSLRRYLDPIWACNRHTNGLRRLELCIYVFGKTKSFLSSSLSSCSELLKRIETMLLLHCGRRNAILQVRTPVWSVERSPMLIVVENDGHRRVGAHWKAVNLWWSSTALHFIVWRGLLLTTIFCVSQFMSYFLFDFIFFHICGQFHQYAYSSDNKLTVTSQASQ